jgi:AraC family ethanolamine operon transcriptional activator
MNMEEKKPLFISQTFNDVDLMAQSSINWKYNAVYKLMPNAFSGANTIMLLPTLQLSFANRSGGLLYDVVSPKGSVTVGVILRADGKMCYGETKLKKGDITFFDDKTPLNLVTNDTVASAIVSIPRKGYRKLTQKLSQHLGEVITDTDGLFAKQMTEILSDFKSDPAKQEDLAYQEAIEKALITQIESLLETQTPKLPKLTKGEKIALQIRDRIYKRVTKKVTIHALAEEFGVSEQTLQNAFKSLFGITPNKFLRNLKLNHVRKALINADPQNDTIVHIANRWGFTHMGHFSRYFTDLFGENPSVTLNRKPPQEDAS